MLRRILAVAAVMSLILAVAIVGLWWHSYRAFDGVAFTARHRMINLGSEYGLAAATWVDGWPSADRGAFSFNDESGSAHPVFVHPPRGVFLRPNERPSFSYEVSSVRTFLNDDGTAMWLSYQGPIPDDRRLSAPMSYHKLLMPFWCVLLPLGVCPLLWLALKVRRRAPAKDE